MSAQISRLVPAALLGLTIGAVAIAAALREVDLAAVGVLIVGAGWGTIALGTAIHLLVQALVGARWRLLVGRPARMSLARAVGLIATGYLANYTLPGRPGELIRCGLAWSLARLPLARGLAGVAVEKVLDGLTIVLCSSVGLLLVGTAHGTTAFLSLGVVVLLSATACLMALALAEAPIARYASREGLVGALARQAATASGTIRLLSGAGMPRSLILSGAAIALSILGHLGAIAWGVGIAPTVPLIIVTYGALGLASLVPGAPGYVGSYQLAAVVAFAPFGLTAEAAIAVATLYQVTRACGALIGSALFAAVEMILARPRPAPSSEPANRP